MVSDTGHRDKHGNTHADNGDDEITQGLAPQAYPQLYGLDSNKPTAGTDGRTYWSSDQNVLWLDDGSSWQKMAVADHDDLYKVNADDHHTAFTPTDHDSRDHSAISDTVRLDEWAVPTSAIDFNNQNLDNVASIDGGGDAVLFDDILDLNSNDLEDGTTTIWDTSAGYIPQGRLQNDSLTVSSGTHLTGGGSVTLGGSTSLSVDESSIEADNLAGNNGTSGQYLKTDGSSASWGTLDSTTWDDYEIQKNGTDGAEIINFKTEQMDDIGNEGA